MIDWAGTAISAGVGALTAAIANFVKSMITEAKHDLRLTNLEDGQKRLESDIDKMDDTYIPRRELQAQLNQMQKPLDRLDKWLDNGLLKIAGVSKE